MISDLSLQLEDGTAMSTLTATALSANYADLTTARDIASGKHIHLHVAVTTAVAGSGGGSVAFELLGMPVLTLAALTSTITVGTNDVVTWTAHGLPAGTAVVFTTSGTLPTGLTPNVVYFVSTASLGTNTFKLGATLDAALAGTPVVSITTGTGSGTHTGTAQPIVLGSSGALPPQLLPALTHVRVIANPALLVGTASGGRQIARPSYRYLFCRYLVAGTITAGKFLVNLMEGMQDGRQQFPSGFQVV